MCSRELCAVAGRLHYPPTSSRSLRYLTTHSSAVNSNLTIGIKRRRISYEYALPSLPSIPMATRMLHSTKATNAVKHPPADAAHDHGHNHNHATSNHTHNSEHDQEDHNHSHSHSHGIFGAFGHTHSREDASTAGAEKMVAALTGGSGS
jgi:hypothetical protein